MWLRPAPRSGEADSGRVEAVSGVVAGKAGAAGNRGTLAANEGAAGPELLALAGLSAPPSMDDVLKGTGLDRNLRMALWLRTASSEEMKAMIQRCQDEGIYDMSLTDGIWLRWVEVDREAAMKSQMINCNWWALAKVDPAGVVAAATAAGPSELSVALRALGQNDFESALALLKDHPEAESNFVWEGILWDMALKDPARASGIALERGMDLKDSLQAWAERDPAAALKWAKAVDDPAKRRKAEAAALRELTTADPAAALRETALLPAGKSRADLTNQALAALERTDPDAALAAARAFANPMDRASALITLAGSFADSDPDRAMEVFREMAQDGLPTKQVSYLMDQEEGGMGPGLRTSSPMSGLAPKLMAAQPGEVFSLMASQRDPDAGVLQILVQAWAGRDPQAASGMIQHLQPGVAKDEAITGLTDWLRSTGPQPDFEAALAWSQAASPDRQVGLLGRVLYAWGQADGPGAQAALDSLALTEEQRTRLQQSLPRPVKP